MEQGKEEKQRKISRKRRQRSRIGGEGGRGMMGGVIGRGKREEG